MQGPLTAVEFHGVLDALCLRREDASRTDIRPKVCVATKPATFAPFRATALGPTVWASSTSAAPDSVLAAVGVGLSIWALLTVRTNISLVPQARQPATGGRYRYFRHSFYGAEYVAANGLAIVTGSGWCWAVVAAPEVLQVLRARSKQALLPGEVDGYAAYAGHAPGFS